MQSHAGDGGNTHSQAFPGMAFGASMSGDVHLRVDHQSHGLIEQCIQNDSNDPGRNGKTSYSLRSPLKSLLRKITVISGLSVSMLQQARNDGTKFFFFFFFCGKSTYNRFPTNRVYKIIDNLSHGMS